MPRIRHIYVRNFRSLKEFSWLPSPGVNCLIGAGDAGKSTILDAIDITLGARRSYPFSDADFYQLDTSSPIEILITIGDLPDELKSIETYGNFLRGFDSSSDTLYDEPNVDNEVVVTIKLTVAENLDPDWRLYSDRAEAEGYERRLAWKHRELISSARLGATSQYHLSWGNRSILNKLSEETLDVSATFAEISRNTRAAFADKQLPEVAKVLSTVKGIADSLGVAVGNLQAQLDVKGVALSTGAIALHDENNTPLRQLGTGSTRLLISGLHKAASLSSILLIDEAEYGLEPFRITRLLNELGSKTDVSQKQIFLTTHSPYVLRELKSQQLFVVRPPLSQTQPHTICCLGAGEVQQATLRACAEAFLSKRVIVCEGKTEIGLIRGIDLFNQELPMKSMYAKGTYCADGGGDSMFARAKVFRELGYPVAILKDSDKATEHAEATQEAQQAGALICEWGNGYAFEDALFVYCPPEKVHLLLNIAINRKGADSVESSIRNSSANQYGIRECLGGFDEAMRPVLASAAKSKGWFKDIEPAERVGREVVAPIYNALPPNFKGILNMILRFAYAE